MLAAVSQQQLIFNFDALCKHVHIALVWDSHCQGRWQHCIADLTSLAASTPDHFRSIAMSGFPQLKQIGKMLSQTCLGSCQKLQFIAAAAAAAQGSPRRAWLSCVAVSGAFKAT